MTTPNTSGATPLPSEIQNVQTQSNNFDASHVICNADGTIDVKGTVSFDPPLPIGDQSLIVSPDSTSQIQCTDGGTAIVTGSIDMQTNFIENLADPENAQDAVTLNYLSTNYTDTTSSQAFVSNAIGDLSTVYMPIDQTLNNIPLADGTLDLNN